MRRTALAALICALMFAAASCGESDSSSADAKASNPDSLLLGLEDLPGNGAPAKGSAPEVCGPLPVLQEDGGQAAISKAYKVGDTRIIEAVGVFDTPAKAGSAFAGLIDRKRLACIGSALRTFGGASSVEIIRSQALDIGDEGSVVRYVAFGEDSELRGYSDVVAVRVGRCTAALLIATESSDPPDAVAEETTETAADRLSGPCEE